MKTIILVYITLAWLYLAKELFYGDIKRVVIDNNDLELKTKFRVVFQCYAIIIPAWPYLVVLDIRNKMFEAK